MQVSPWQEGYIAQQVAFAKAKTWADKKSIATYDSVDDFIASAGIAASKRAIADKAQNIDLASPQKVQNFMSDLLSNQAFLKQTPKEQQAIIDDFVKAGVLKQGSTPNRWEANTGEAFAVGMAKLSAGATNKTNRFVAGGLEFVPTQNVGSGHIATIAASKTDIYTHGRKDHDKQGKTYDNPVQATLNGAGVDTTSSDGVGEMAGDAVQVIAAGGAVYAFDKMTGGHLAKGGKSAARKAQNVGSKLVRRFTGNNTFDESKYSRSHQKEDRYDNQADPKSAVGAKNFHDKTPSFLKDIEHYTTNTEYAKAKERLSAADPQAVAREAVRSSLSEAGRAYPRRSPERTAIAQMMGDLKNGRPIDAQRFSELTGKEVPAGRGDLH